METEMYAEVAQWSEGSVDLRLNDDRTWCVISETRRRVPRSGLRTAPVSQLDGNLFCLGSEANSLMSPTDAPTLT